MFPVADETKEKRDWTAATALSVLGTVVILINYPTADFCQVRPKIETQRNYFPLHELIYANCSIFERVWCKKKRDESSKISKESLSILEAFLSNVNKDLACEIKECWIDPQAFSAETIVGRGKFKIIFFLYFPRTVLSLI